MRSMTLISIRNSWCNLSERIKLKNVFDTSVI